MNLKLEDFKRIDGYDSLFASFSLVFHNACDGGLKVHNCTLRKNRKDGRYFIGFPVKPYKDDDGEEKFARHVTFPDKDAFTAIQEFAIAKAKELCGIESDGLPF